jgi:hypothetical protein
VGPDAAVVLKPVMDAMRPEAGKAMETQDDEHI